jgi:hypothetical protein
MSIFKRRDPSELQNQMKQFDKKGFESDLTEWKPTLDKTGAGSAVIRFLPSIKDDATTFVKVVTHGFQRSGKWYIENCPSTHGDYDSCPVCRWIKDQNWDYNVEADRNAMYASGTTRKVGFWANILVVKDPANPDNEGKVFKWRFGKKVLDKINAQITVDESLGETPCDVTCPWTGKNFTLKIEKVGGHSNYDKSSFGDVKAIPNIDDEAFQQKLFSGMQDIMSIAAKDKFKSDEELTTIFNRVMGSNARAASSGAVGDFENQMNNFSAEGSKAAPAPADREQPAKSNEPADASIGVGDDDDLDALINEL